MIPHVTTPCAECDGLGSYWVEYPTAGGVDGIAEYNTEEVTCDECNGTGYVTEEVA